MVPQSPPGNIDTAEDVTQPSTQEDEGGGKEEAEEKQKEEDDTVLRAHVGLVLPIWGDMIIQLDGDG